MLKSQNMEQTKNFDSASNLKSHLLINNNPIPSYNKKSNQNNNSSPNNSNSVSSLIINSNHHNIYSFPKNPLNSKNKVLHSIKNTSNTLEIPIEFNINNSNGFRKNVQNNHPKENDTNENFRSYISKLKSKIKINFYFIEIQSTPVLYLDFSDKIKEDNAICNSKFQELQKYNAELSKKNKGDEELIKKLQEEVKINNLWFYNRLQD